MTAVTIRPAREGDLDALIALYRVFGSEKPSAAPAAGARAQAILAQVLADGARHLVVAERDRVVCGTADMLIVANLTHHGAPWAIVENVVVAAEQRRRGVGSAIMAHLLHLAREHGCYKVQLLSGKHRGGAHAMYESVGLRAAAEGFKVWFDEGPPAGP